MSPEGIKSKPLVLRWVIRDVTQTCTRFDSAADYNVLTASINLGDESSGLLLPKYVVAVDIPQEGKMCECKFSDDPKVTHGRAM